MNLEAYALIPNPQKLVPAPPERAWMDAFKGGHAYRCLPLVIGILAIALTGCRQPARTYSSNSTFTPGPTIADFTENYVRVVASLESDELHRPLLRATFTPLEFGFHLYGKDLPETGAHGVTFPTRLDIPNQSSIHAVGPAFSDVAPHDQQFEALGVTLPIYPEGPVTIRLPVDLSPAQGGATAQLAFTYMACQTDGICRRPTDHKLVEAKIPKVR